MTRRRSPHLEPRRCRAAYALSVPFMLALVLGCQASEPSATRRAHPTLREAFPSVHPAGKPAVSAVERALRREPLSYADSDRGTRFYPEGMYVEPRSHQLWVWSSRHAEQRGFIRAGDSWRPIAASREGPAETRRCVAFSRRPLTLCLGRREPRAFRSYGTASFASQLPERGGFVDFAVDEGRGRIYVLDAYLNGLWVLDASGAVVDRRELGPNPSRVGLLGTAHLFVLAGAAPRLQIVPIEGTGPRIALDPVATIRAAAFDSKAGLLWTAGYRQERVRRRHGYIENLESFLYAYREADLVAGTFAPVRAIDLSQHRLTDPTALVPLGAEVFTVLTGSGRLARLGTDRRAVTVDIERSGQAPKSLLAVADQIVTSGFLDGRIVVHARSDLSVIQVLELDAGPPESSPYHTGEALFYTKAMWSDSSRNQFTCNSCHWDGLTDHRMHPGTRESRWEQIRPAAGVGMLSPIFTPGQARSLTAATHGFVRALDERFWANPTRRYWLEDIRLDAGESTRVLNPYQVRIALVTYLARRSVEPGMLRAPGQPFSDSARRGAAIFWRDCARCHRPAPSAKAPRAMSLDDGLAYLVDRPLAFSANRREKTGVLPYFTREGNRVSPLTQLSRGGPFFSNGSSPTLRHAIERTRPDANAVHAPGNAAAPAYSKPEIRALIDFLLSI